MAPAVSGIVLAGGAGRRIGADKAVLEFGGRTLLEITVERLLEITDDVVVACGRGRRAGWPELSVPLVVDGVDNRGPLAGLAAGLNAISHEAAVVVACDMPFLNPALLKHIADRLDTHDALVPEVGGREHPLHGAYSKRCLPAVEVLLARGGSMRDLLDAVGTSVMPEDEVRAIDPEALSCFNINHAEDLERARSLWGDGQREVATAG